MRTLISKIKSYLNPSFLKLVSLNSYKIDEDTYFNFVNLAKGSQKKFLENFWKKLVVFRRWGNLLAVVNIVLSGLTLVALVNNDI